MTRRSSLQNIRNGAMTLMTTAVYYVCLIHDSKASVTGKGKALTVFTFRDCGSISAPSGPPLSQVLIQNAIKHLRPQELQCSEEYV